MVIQVCQPYTRPEVQKLWEYYVIKIRKSRKIISDQSLRCENGKPGFAILTQNLLEGLCDEKWENCGNIM